MLTFYKNYKFISEEEARRCIRQWPHFRSRVSKWKREEVYDVYVDIVNENEDDIDSMLILLSSMMIISCSTRIFFYIRNRFIRNSSRLSSGT